MELKRRHKVIFALLRPVVRAVFRLFFPLRPFRFQAPVGVNPPYLILANHTSDLDPIFLSLCFSFPVFYVASDHLFRLGFLSKVLRSLFSPIPKQKSTNDAQTIRDIVSSLRSGASVGIFAEGDKAWAGETEEIAPSIGKLARMLRVPLVVCRIEGAYLSMPRWAKTLRRGPIDLKLVRVLSTEQVRAINADELNELIRKDLHANAEADRQAMKARYRGKDLAESIEMVLYTCPQCKCFATIRSMGDAAWCGCGLRFRCDADTILHDAPFASVLKWDRWQTENLRSVLAQAVEVQSAAPVFSDMEQQLYGFERAKHNTLVATGQFSMFLDRLIFQGEQETIEFALKDLQNMSIHGMQTLQFSLLDGRQFEVICRHPRSAYKYLQAYKVLTRSGCV